MGCAELVKEYYKLAGFEPDVSLAENLVHEEYNEWYEETEHLGVQTYKPDLELKELADLIYVIHGYALARGWDIDEAVRRVHENNVGRMKQPDGSIKRRADGKVLRNKDYPKVDLKGLT